MTKMRLEDLAHFPRPDFARESFTLLDGRWQFAFDQKNMGVKQRWFDNPQFNKNINVPFCVESTASGIGQKNPPQVMWYARTALKLPTFSSKERLILHFGAADYRTQVWLNGQYLGEHFGGYTPFQFDITDQVKAVNTLVVRVEDSRSWHQPRGKQTTFSNAHSIFYPAVSGIWQSVWVEKVGRTYVDRLVIKPDLDQRKVYFSGFLGGDLSAGELKITVTHVGEKTKSLKLTYQAGEKLIEGSLRFDQILQWIPDSPELYQVKVELISDQAKDTVHSYFGWRKIQTKQDKIYLNNQQFYQKLILVQGYYPGGLYTPVNQEQYKKDVLLVKQAGFNGLRMHEKIEHPQFLFWCDVLGCVVWEEMPSAFYFSQSSKAALAQEWQEVLRRDINHPSTIAWVPCNESWGLAPFALSLLSSKEAIHFVKELAQFTKNTDPTRLVIDNSGFDHTDKTDVVDLHVYLKTAAATKRLLQKFHDTKESFAWWRLLLGVSVRSPWRLRFARGENYHGQPIMASEYGGFGFFKTRENGNLAELFRVYTQVIQEETWLSGYCFTQLYDTFQEKDGLFDFNRLPKTDVAVIKKINSKNEISST